MKLNSTTLLIAAALLLSACGTTARFASSDNGQKFRDGIYNNTPAFRTKAEKEESKSETQALVEKTKESPVYLFGERKDSIVIPQNMAATIKYDQNLGSTVVTVAETPYNFVNDYSYYYSPYSIGSSWYYSRHYYPWSAMAFSIWRPIHIYDPWYYGSFYDPWHYGGIYDPWYYGSYYSPWYYAGYYDPWYHHQYAGWYGGWDPYWGHHHHGPGHGPGFGPDRPQKNVWYGSRAETGSDRVFSSSTSLRGGLGSRSTISRSTTASSTAATRAENTSAGRGTSVRRATTSGGTGTPSRTSGISTVSRQNSTLSRRPASTANKVETTNARPSGTVTAGRRPVSTTNRPSTNITPNVQTNHRRPAVSTGSGSYRPSSSGTSSGYRSTTPSSNRQTYNYNSSSSTSERSSSSYSRSSSSSSSSSRSSYSSGSSSSSRSSSSSSSYSRSGGSAGGRR